MKVLTSLTALADYQRATRNAAAESGGVLVPTMGALHQGHIDLIRHAAARAQAESITQGCMVTIFVNPTQFNDQADFARYPKTLDADLAACQAAGAAAVFAPSPTDIYPERETIPVPPLPPVATEPGLEDVHRPGHFAGVCQVVLRLFQLTRPRQALFGEKDWQQLQVIAAMTRAQHLPITILSAQTVREPDGLAMSSRNRFLSPAERLRARVLSRALCEANAAATPAAAESRMREALADESITPDYAVVRDAQTLLAPTGDPSRPMRALIAAPVGPIRLIDNAPWTPAHP